MTTIQSGSQGAVGSIVTLRLWINAFIPRNLEGAKIVAGSGEHSGKTMLPTPGPINAWFLTDQREFSSALDAHSRMHSEIEFDLAAMAIRNEVHRCHPTVQVDDATGEALCTESADTSGMAFSDFQVAPGQQSLSISLKGSTKNPCLKIGPVKITPNLDYEGTITVDIRDERHSALITFDGSIEVYPAFEMYASVNGGAPYILFREDVVPGTTPTLLAGPPTRRITHQLHVKA